MRSLYARNFPVAAGLTIYFELISTGYRCHESPKDHGGKGKKRRIFDIFLMLYMWGCDLWV